MQLTQCLHCHLLAGLGIAPFAFEDFQPGSLVVPGLMRGVQTRAPALQLSLASSLRSPGFPTPSSGFITCQGQPEPHSQGRWYLVHLVIDASTIYRSSQGHHVQLYGLCIVQIIVYVTVTPQSCAGHLIASYINHGPVLVLGTRDTAMNKTNIPLLSSFLPNR